MIESATNTDPASQVQAPFRPSWRVKSLFAGVAVVFAVLCGEVLIRLFAPQPASWLDIYARHPNLETYALQPHVHREVELGEGRWIVDTGDFGFRVGAPGPVDRRAVLCLGDSFTFGNGVNADQSFVGLLDAHRVLGSPWINAGVPGYGPIQYRQVLEYLLGQGFAPPQVVIGTYVGNDFHDCVWKADSRVVDGILGNRGGFRSFIKRNSHGYRLISRCYHRFVPQATDAYAFREDMYTPENWEEGLLKTAGERLRVEFEAVARLCREHGIPLLVVILPIRDAIESTDSAARSSSHPARDPSLPVAKMESILEHAGIRTLDLMPSLRSHPEGGLYFVHDGHFTPAAHRIAFEAIREALTTPGG